MSKPTTQTPLSLNCAVVTISDTRNAHNDTAGDYLTESLRQAGHRCVQRTICAGDMYQIRKLMSDWIVDPEVQVILVNGGTGYTHQKSTVSAIAPLFDQTITGFGELFRHLSYLDIGSSMLQSDAIAGIANNTLVFCMPGSPNACKTAWEGIIRDQLNSTHRPCNFGTAYHA